MSARACATTLESELLPDELGTLLRLLGEVPPDGRVLEIGTAAGGTLCAMMRRFEDHLRPRFVAIDPMTYFERQLEIVQSNLERWSLDPRSVELRVATSAEAFEQAARCGEAFDLILIDGAHKIRYVMQDLRWARLLKKGGLLCLHDYNDQHKGVKWSADRFLSRHPTYRHENTTASLFTLRKTEAGAAAEAGFGDQLWAAACSPYLQLERSVRKRLVER